MQQQDFLSLLEYLLTVYPTQPIILLVDNDRSHTAHEVTNWLRQHPRIHLHFLLKSCSHLNPVEPI